MDIVTRYESERIKVGVAGPLVVALYRAAPTVDDMRALDRVEEGVLGSYEKLSMVTVVRQTGALNMPSDVRQVSVEMSDKYAPKLVGSALVVATKGLAAAMARSILSALVLAMRGDLPLKNFSALPEALTWLRGLPGQHPQVSELDLQRLEQYLA